MSKIGILGTGAWGTALANLLLENHHEVLMWGVDSSEVESLTSRTNPKYFSNKKLIKVPNVVTTNINNVLKQKPPFIILAIPSAHLIATLELLIQHLDYKPIIINVAKGLNPKNSEVWSQTIKRIINHKSKGLVTLIGPSFANEVFNNEPTMVNTISKNLSLAKQVSKLFNNHHFKCVEITDEIGAEILGALKNVMAIAMGIAYELHTSINTRAAMLAQAAKETFNIMRLYHGKPETIMQFCGIGDIFLTCTDDKSRNFSFGKQVAKIGIDKTLKLNHKTVEGYQTTATIYQFIAKHKLRAPLLNMVFCVLFKHENPKKFVKKIMANIIE